MILLIFFDTTLEFFLIPCWIIFVIIFSAFLALCLAFFATTSSFCFFFSISLNIIDAICTSALDFFSIFFRVFFSYCCIFFPSVSFFFG